jgi:hypothetical protein
MTVTGLESNNHQSNRLWGIACYFNPAGYRNRLANYRTFIENLSVPLVAVELSYGSEFELGPGDATILIQVKGSDVLWQKERLLNIALAALPEQCDAVAYLDADVVFERNDWAERSLTLLESVPLIQPFADFCDLPPQTNPRQFRPEADALSGRSLAAMVKDGYTPHQLLQTCGARFKSAIPSAGGFAWVVRRSILDRHGFYDTCIVGSGNHAMVAATYGVPDLSVSSLCMNESRAEHFLSWAEPYFQEVGGQVGYLTGAIYHLWHGDLEDRKYRERHESFSTFNFNPTEDIRLDEKGCWQWSSDKPAMHNYVREYFNSRKEDG